MRTQTDQLKKQTNHKLNGRLNVNSEMGFPSLTNPFKSLHYNHKPKAGASILSLGAFKNILRGREVSGKRKRLLCILKCETLTDSMVDAKHTKRRTSDMPEDGLPSLSIFPNLHIPFSSPTTNSLHGCVLQIPDTDCHSFLCLHLSPPPPPNSFKVSRLLLLTF